MTVRELIDLLGTFNPDDVVLIANDGGRPSEACEVWQYDEESIERY